MKQSQTSIQMSLFDYFIDEPMFTVKEAIKLVKDIKKMSVNNESIRARIYEGVDKGIFTKISRGVYKVESQILGSDSQCLLINGDGRDLSMIEDDSIDGIVTDHPYRIVNALYGGNRKFASYELFKYKKRDFEEKCRVLKKGAFLVEFLPEESEANYEYLFEIKKIAKECGFEYYAKVPWKKGTFVSNTGRKAKNTEDVMIFSKGKARQLKLDTKKNIALAKEKGIYIKKMSSSEVKNVLEENHLSVVYMKGTNGMLPSEFNHQPKSKKEKTHEAEKPIMLLEEIIEYISKPYEVLLDQFAGSGNFAIACENRKRSSIVIEKDKEIYKKMRENIQNHFNKHSLEKYANFKEIACVIEELNEFPERYQQNILTKNNFLEYINYLNCKNENEEDKIIYLSNDEFYKIINGSSTLKAKKFFIFDENDDVLLLKFQNNELYGDKLNSGDYLAAIMWLLDFDICIQKNMLSYSHNQYYFFE